MVAFCFLSILCSFDDGQWEKRWVKNYVAVSYCRLFCCGVLYIQSNLSYATIEQETLQIGGFIIQVASSTERSRWSVPRCFRSVSNDHLSTPTNILFLIIMVAEDRFRQEARVNKFLEPNHSAFSMQIL